MLRSSRRVVQGCCATIFEAPAYLVEKVERDHLRVLTLGLPLPTAPVAVAAVWRCSWCCNSR